eukprot:TRINITY_DN2307_c0_g1_i1.p1 TRINITY_DN2307_c0_g1~~TRINITY_DN2307_c0_g1_i1.p1  ORF type:complete len:595 (-),score=115.08 TRINITY_DN2307_c0_g1_i1:183-1862(-)
MVTATPRVRNTFIEYDVKPDLGFELGLLSGGDEDVGDLKNFRTQSDPTGVNTDSAHARKVLMPAVAEEDRDEEKDPKEDEAGLGELDEDEDDEADILVELHRTISVAGRPQSALYRRTRGVVHPNEEYELDDADEATEDEDLELFRTVSVVGSQVQRNMVPPKNRKCEQLEEMEQAYDEEEDDIALEPMRTASTVGSQIQRNMGPPKNRKCEQLEEVEQACDEEEDDVALEPLRTASTVDPRLVWVSDSTAKGKDEPPVDVEEEEEDDRELEPTRTMSMVGTQTVLGYHGSVFPQVPCTAVMPSVVWRGPPDKHSAWTLPSPLPAPAVAAQPIFQSQSPTLPGRAPKAIIPAWQAMSSSPTPMPAGVLGDRLHRFHREAASFCTTSSDMRTFAKGSRYQGRLSTVTEAEVHRGGVHRYHVEITGGKISRADGIGFVFSPRLPCTKDIQKIVSVYLNHHGESGMRLYGETQTFRHRVPRLRVGDVVEMEIDLDARVVQFGVWRLGDDVEQTRPRPMSCPELAYGRIIDDFVRTTGRPVDGTVGHLACVVKNVGASMSLLS